MKPARILSLLPFLALTHSASAAFVAHEWGTFTSLQGSDGVPLEGLEIEDDPLPEFVHSRVEPELRLTLASDDACGPGCRISWAHGCLCPPPRQDPPRPPAPAPRPTYIPPEPRPFPKGMEFPTDPGTPFAVNQKMETPVLYLHSDRELDAQVEVDFPGGILGQYYPAPSKVVPEVGKAERLANGYARFDVKVLTEEAQLPHVDPSNIYAPSREVKANTLVTPHGETEKFIFYRGLGKFRTAMKVTSQGNEITLHDAETGPKAQAAFLVYSDGSRGSIRMISLAKGRMHPVSAQIVQHMKSRLLEETEFHHRAEQFLGDALVESGLYRDEAVAMVRTWNKSYFRTPGLRVLYLLSREETEKLLPMRISPQPDQVVRTLVGRIEILTDAEEQELLQLAEYTPVRQLVEKFGRFAQAKVLRLIAISTRADSTRKLLETYDELRKHRVD
jgi:hypothetical protein